MAQVLTFTPRRASRSGLLRAARERSGVSVDEFAARLGRAIRRPELSPGTIRAWESGTVPPPAEVLEAAQRLSSPAPQDGSPLAATAPEAPAWSTLPSSVGWPATAPPPTTPTAIEAVMQAFRDADRQVGGGYVYGAVIRYLEHEIAPQLFTGTRDTFSAAAALTEMAGWMAHDAGDDTIAHQHFQRALGFAAATDDIELSAHIHARHSHLAQHLDARATGSGSLRRGELSCAAAITTPRSRLACTRWRPALLPPSVVVPTAPGCS
jgi:hypothetical protein